MQVKGADLRNSVGVRDQNGEQTAKTEIKIEITNINIVTPTIKGVIALPVKSKEGTVAKGSFNFSKSDTSTGAFKSVATGASQGASSDVYRIQAKGIIEGDLAAPLVPTGDVTIVIGDGGSDATITVPQGAFKVKGAGEKSVYPIDFSNLTQRVKFGNRFQNPRSAMGLRRSLAIHTRPDFIRSNRSRSSS